MARLPTGVTLVTANHGDGPAGATANAVTSLSLEPPLILACLDRGSRTLRVVEAAGRFGVSVLSSGQAHVARGFATKAPHEEKWRGVSWEERDGVPVLADCLLWVTCELGDVIAGGDHVILTGSVLGLGAAEGEPLLFHDGAYRGLER